MGLSSRISWAYGTRPAGRFRISKLGRGDADEEEEVCGGKGVSPRELDLVVSCGTGPEGSVGCEAGRGGRGATAAQQSQQSPCLR